METDVPDSLEAKLERLLSEDTASALQRTRSTFDESVAPFEDSLVLFGAGIVGRRALAGLRALGISPLAFTDNNPALWNRAVEGLKVLHPQEAADRWRARAAFVVSVTMWNEHYPFRSIRDQLLNLGVTRIVSCGRLFWRYPATFLPDGALDSPDKVIAQAAEVRECSKLWADEPSRQEYLRQLRLRLLWDVEGLSAHPPEEEYFPTDLLTPSPEEVFIDCGACDGDTIRGYLEWSAATFAEILAFEPDPMNLEALRKYVSSLPPHIRRKLTALPVAVSDRRQRLRFTASGEVTSALDAAGNVEVEGAPLDEILVGKQPTFIKMDIEGAELEALAGTERIISTFAPVLAICVYHVQDHLWRIPRLIASISDQYWFSLRAYGVNGIDVVCYAVPRHRLAKSPALRIRPL